MDNNQNNNERIELDQKFLDMLADKFTAKQFGQDKPDPTKAVNTLATMLASFYNGLRRCGVPRSLSFKLTIALLHLTMQH